MFECFNEQLQHVLAEFHDYPGPRRLLAGRTGVMHYRWLLRQIFHHARGNAQIQARAAAEVRGPERERARKFRIRLQPEIGSDRLVLNDLAALGDDVGALRRQSPLPATTALLVFPLDQIRSRNPVGYLGHLFFLEFMPTQAGGRYMTKLAESGVPATAMSYIHVQTRVDGARRTTIESQVECLVRTRADRDSLLCAMHVTAHLYAEMVRSAFEQVDDRKQWDLSGDECGRVGRVSGA